MKKLYKGKIHPSSLATATATATINDRLSLLPAAIFTLTVALSPEDREVLGYLISCAGGSKTPAFSLGEYNCGGGGGGDHPPEFDCNCFRCYMNYWVRWDKSANRQLIHEILEAYEDGIFNWKKNQKRKKRSNKGKRVFHAPPDITEAESKLNCSAAAVVTAEVTGELDKTGSVKKIVSFIGEKIWGIWGV